MVRFKDMLGLNAADRVLRRRSPDEPFVFPYNPHSQPQPDPQSHPEPESAPPMPSAAPPGVPEPIPEPMPTFMPDFSNTDVKLDLSATYSPGPMSPGAMSPGPLPVPPPGYVSREPSVATPPYTRQYERPAIPAGYGRSAAPSAPIPPVTRPQAHAPQMHIPSTHMPPMPAPATHFRTPSMTSAPPTSTYYTHPPMPTAPPPHVHYEPPPMPAAPAPPAPSPGPRRESQPPAPGDLPLERAAGQKISPEELRELRELIRQRYQLDLQIWSERFLRPRDRDITQAKIRKADALMNKIRRTVITWNRPEYFEHGTGDYEGFQEIARRIHLEGKKDWVNEPPWMPERRLY